MKISVITVNRNNADGLRRTIQSVIEQSFSDFEYIIIDGASEDGSLDVIREYKLAFEKEGRVTYKYISEPDTGVFQAMNKGIKRSLGDYLLFLNSGDYFYDSNVLSQFASLDSKEDYVSGNLIIEIDGRAEIRPSPKKVDFLFFFNNSLPHQATFISRDVFNRFGLYNEKNKVKSDWELSLRSLVVGGASYKHIDQIISFFDITGISSQDKFVAIKHEEQRRVYLSLMPSYVLDTLMYYQNQQSSFTQKIQLYNEYLSIKNGKLGKIIDLLLWIKRSNRKIKKTLGWNKK